MNNKVIAIIPARGGSKRIPNKNIKSFAGQPIISYSIKAAQAADLFDRIIVSTDSEEIAEVAKIYGAEVPFIRPAELADDFVGTDEVVLHALKFLLNSREKLNYVCCIYATAPFIRSEDIRIGFELLRNYNATSTFTVTSFPSPIFRSLKINDSGRIEMFWPQYLDIRSQDLPEAYHDAGQFYWADAKKCEEVGIMFLSTPQNRSDLDLLLEVGIPAIKVGSDDFTNQPLLKSYAATNLPIIISSGMSDLAEVYQALEAVDALDGYPTILLLCTSQYPTPPEDVNLLKLKTLANSFPMVVTGFSDHTQGPLASSLAVAMGASFFEKHFTLDHNLPGPDHWFSEDPDGLKGWIVSIRTVYTMMGNAIVRATKAEKAMKKLARRSIVAIRDINPGETLTLSNVGLKRPGNGLPPSLLDQVLESKAITKIYKGTCLQFGDFEEWI